MCVIQVYINGYIKLPVEKSTLGIKAIITREHRTRLENSYLTGFPGQFNLFYQCG